MFSSLRASPGYWSPPWFIPKPHQIWKDKDSISLPLFFIQWLEPSWCSVNAKYNEPSFLLSVSSSFLPFSPLADQTPILCTLCHTLPGLRAQHLFTLEISRAEGWSKGAGHSLARSQTAVENSSLAPNLLGHSTQLSWHMQEATESGREEDLSFPFSGSVSSHPSPPH